MKTSTLFFFFTFTFLFLPGSIALGQSLKGKVIDKNGEPIPFAKVRIHNSSFGTVANAIGIYQIEIKSKNVVLLISATNYRAKKDSINLVSGLNTRDFILEDHVQVLNEIVIVSKTKKERGKEIMKKVIKKRALFHEQLSEFSCETYCIGSLEKEIQDSILQDSIISKESMNLIEWKGKSFYKADRRFKDEFTAYNDLTDEKKVSTGNNLSISMDYGPVNLSDGLPELESDPYLFCASFKQVAVNIFENQLQLPHISSKPIVSPLAFNALIYYNFFLENSFIDTDSSFVYEIQVLPKFKKEALFSGTLFIRDESWELVSYDLGINPEALTYFKEMQLICNYSKFDNRLIPTRREFVYHLKEGRTKMNGHIQVMHDNYSFNIDDTKRHFWQESSVYAPNAFIQDTAYWNRTRPVKLRDFEERFINQQDSAILYHESAEYLKRTDSIRNRISILDVIFDGVGHVNSFKKQEWSINGLISQVVPFGVGGFRYRLTPTYSKEFENAKKLRLFPKIDYGFLNRDLKGSVGASFMYNPLSFSEVFFDVGDQYDFISNYENIQGVFAPGNRVRNQKLEIGYKTELINGVYFKSSFLYSKRQSIDSLKYPDWVSAFGQFSTPQPFKTYKIFLSTFDFEIHFGQKYVIRKNKKIVLGSPWPVLNVQYKKGIPNLAGTEANFDFLEVRAHDDIQLNTLGKAELSLLMGVFIHKKDLRVIEHKFFRTSDRYFFSNPVNSLQLLDTALNTSNSYLQFNFIHHFNGFFLNKVWLINKLKLEETIGGSLIYIPDANFAQVEFYAGIERKFRIRKEIFKLGIYAVSYDNNISAASIRLKFGFNNYNSFSGTWDY